MSFLKLDNIGKIYVSKGAVAVGIRHVNAEFERGEFVAVTGASGSGKSTLLNVLSGMDSYEEGELYIEGKPTSHFTQEDWEAYREKYISFIFQDYNILESFTVLQNVELALMHIDDRHERRMRAMELLRKVGLENVLKNKGSQLSGGQKQRTVIARALAKDSPIILADEPTGNLDSKTADEIIELLSQVAKDKLVIVVTHNFDQVQAYATRHIRIFDGSVESDHMLHEPRMSSYEPEEARQTIKESKHPKRDTLRKGIHLGVASFLSKPKLTFFICFLFLVASIALFSTTASLGSNWSIFEDTNLFTPYNGRLILTKDDGSKITSSELEQLRVDLGAKSAMHFDECLDSGSVEFWDENYNTYSFKLTLDQDYGTPTLGRYPEAKNEIFIYAPIGYSTYFGLEELSLESIPFQFVNWDIVGVKYYYDNNIMPEILFTSEGFELATATYYLSNSIISWSASCVNTVGDKLYSDDQNELLTGFESTDSLYYWYPTTYFRSEMGTDFESTAMEQRVTISLLYGNQSSTIVLNQTQSAKETPQEEPAQDLTYSIWGGYDAELSGVLYLSYDEMESMVFSLLEDNYAQASLFFENNAQAKEACKKLTGNGYIALLSNETTSGESLEVLISSLSCLISLFGWIISIVFLAFFTTLCSGKALETYRTDIAIMRSMGIPMNIIRVSIPARIFLALIPSLIILPCFAVYVYTSPTWNTLFNYLYWYHYVLLALGLFYMIYRVSRKTTDKLFGDSVKKTLRGGADS